MGPYSLFINFFVLFVTVSKTKITFVNHLAEFVGNIHFYCLLYCRPQNSSSAQCWAIMMLARCCDAKVPVPVPFATLIKKKLKFFSNRKFRWERLQSHILQGLPNIWGKVQIFRQTVYEEAVRHIGICNRSLLDFLICEENFVFFFYQCTCPHCAVRTFGSPAGYTECIQTHKHWKNSSGIWVAK